MNKPKLKKQPRAKFASQEDIEFACEMICREFGVIRNMSFKISHDTIGHILQKKNNKLETEDYRNFLSEMTIHQYFVTVTNDHFIFVHLSLINSLREADMDMIKCFEYCKENNIGGCPSNDTDEYDNSYPNSKKHLH